MRAKTFTSLRTPQPSGCFPFVLEGLELVADVEMVGFSGEWPLRESRLPLLVVPSEPVTFSDTDAPLVNIRGAVGGKSENLRIGEEERDVEAEVEGIGPGDAD